MRKILALVLCLIMAVSCIPAMAEEAAAVKTGLCFEVSNTTGRGGAGYQTNILLAGVTVDDNGVIDACAFDYVQAKTAIDENGVITTDKAISFKSKQELGDGYAMRAASSISAEWNEQANAFAAFCVGKTLEEVKAAEQNENGQIVDIITSCTLEAGEFLPALEAAVTNAAHLGAKKGDTLKLGQYSVLGAANDATAEADGKLQVYTHAGVITLNGETITSAYIDASQANITFNGKGETTSDLAAEILTKNELKEGYNMKGASPIGKEWYEQNAYFCEYITGKTLTEAIAVATNPGETDVVTGCTIKTNGYMSLLEKLAK